MWTTYLGKTKVDDFYRGFACGAIALYDAVRRYSESNDQGPAGDSGGEVTSTDPSHEIPRAK
jgi:hypothetical protein